MLVTDVDTALQAEAERAGARWTTVDLLAEALDVLVPAATGGMLTHQTARTCQAALIVGPANNQLAHDSVDAVLHERGITWVPDVLASVGGIIHAVSREELGLDGAVTYARVERIGDKTADLLAYAAEQNTTPLLAARRIAAQTTTEVPA